MKIVLLFSFIVSGFVLKAQEAIRPFTDYEACLTGFVTRSGDTVIPPKYSSVQALYPSNFERNNPDHSINAAWWVVEEYGLFGLINHKGEEVFASEFNEFGFDVRELLMMKKEGKWGALSFDGKVLIPFEFNQYSQLDFEHGLLFMYKDPFVGVWNLHHDVKMTVPATTHTKVKLIHDWMQSVEINDSTGYYKYHEERFYQTWNNNKLGLLDFDGKELFPNTFDELYPLFLRTKCLDSVRFFSGVKDGTTGIYKEDGSLIRSFDGTLRQIHTPHGDDCGDKMVFQIIVKQNKRRTLYQLVDFETGKRSEPFIDLERFEDFFILEHGKSQSIIDLDLNVILEPQKMKLQSSLSGRDEYRGFDLEEWSMNLPSRQVTTEDSIVIQKDPESWKIGLFNFWKQTATPKEYNYIVFLSDDERRFFWCIDQHDGVSAFSLDVFDRSLNLMAHHDSISFMEELVYEDLETFRDYTQFIRNEADKIAVLDIDGSFILPFEYQRVSGAYRQPDRNNPYLIDAVYSLEKANDSVSILLDGDFHPIGLDKAEEILWVDSYYGTTFATKWKNQYNVYDSLGKKILSNVDYVQLNGGLKEEMPSLLFIKGKHLYLYSNDSIQLFNPMDLSERDRSYQVPRSIVYNDSGQVLTFGNLHFTKTGELYNVYHYPDRTSQLLDGEGNVLLESKEKITIRKNSQGYHIQYRDNYDPTTGILSYDLKTWVLPPGYKEIQPINYPVDGYFCKKNGGWYLLSKNLDTLVPYFMRSRFAFHGSYAHINVRNKYGIIDNQLRTIIPPEYDNVLRRGSKFYVQKNGLWGAYSPDSMLIPPKYTDINLRLNFTTIAFTEDSVFFLDPHSLKVQAGYNSYEFYPALYERFDQIRKSHIRIYMYQTNELGDARKELLIEHLKELLLQTGLNNSDPYEAAKAFPEYNQESTWFPENYKYNKGFSLEITCYGEHYSVFKRNLSQYSILRKERNREVHLPQQFHLLLEHDYYRTSRPSLASLFNNYEIPDYIREELARQIQEQQRLGLACADVDAAVEGILENFYLEPRHLVFQFHNQNSRGLYIPYVNLKDYLLHPEDFIE